MKLAAEEGGACSVEANHRREKRSNNLTGNWNLPNRKVKRKMEITMKKKEDEDEENEGKNAESRKMT